jgi:XTP/dITP diphosphohydrolase
MSLLIATHNLGKLREFQEVLEGLPIELVTLDDVGIHEDVEETGETLEENARLKAVTYARQSGLLALGDDSGLEVDALGGEPGVFSKRYAGEGKSDAERIEYLLEKLRGVRPEKRTARFRCAIVVSDPDGQTWTSEGTCEGAIALEARGTNGFGYDPIFIVSETGNHMAELTPDVKNRVSHRGRAAQDIKQILMDLQKKGV